ncbi:chemosensory pili system protein ChpA (sensor histidine kinase/response regulator) [Allochromatium warmingii]|uniref:Chemotaxis protein CheA n=1 Tax=Allochromatium warmingii TaxID=61595 RepID=A0A1H3IFY8_ALLWA|nr:Hpt domain-containing protein [Allochromatium warmingii]SDY26527.1 chemosensory pili system protein ChpA (sensor histidine kinase/response regulator) [Allochromatium warmingii]
MADKQLIGGLQWVKSEIGATLRPVRDLIEAGTDFDTETELPAALKALDQVQGVLLALRLTAPAQLVAAMQQLIEALDPDSPERYIQATTALDQALTQLSTHLDRLDAGLDDSPLTLLPSLNALRAAAGEHPPLTQADWLHVTLAASDSAATPAPEQLERLAAVIRQVRPSFHRHLVEWYKDTSLGLAPLSRLFRQLVEHLHAEPLVDLFRLAELIVDTLQDGRLPASPQVRTVLGHLDRVLKPLAQQPPVWPQADLQSLLTQALERLTQAGIDAPWLAELELKYAAAEDLALPAPAADVALAQVASELAAQLAELKTSFDQAQAAEVGVQLQQLASRLEAVAVGHPLAMRLRTLGEHFQTRAAQDSDAMELLGIESALLALANHRAAEAEQWLAPDLDLSDLTAATLREAGYELLQIKESIADWQADPSVFEVLIPVPSNLLGVAGALRMLGQNPAAEVAERVAELVQVAYVQQQHSSTATQIDALAEAIAGLELYISHLQQPMPLGETLIDRAGQAIAVLQAEIGEWSASALSAAVEPPSAPVVSVEPEPEPKADNDADDGETTFLDIFLEEANEELDSARIQLARWQADPTDAQAVATLRRSFHTLKGSGRLVGALQVGDFAQAMEFLLNRLIELKAHPSTAILDCIADAVRTLPDLVAAEAAGTTFDIEPSVSRATELRAALSVVVAELPSGVSELSVLSVPVPVPTGLTVDAESLLADDDELLDIFRGEAQEHVSVVRAFLAAAPLGEPRQSNEALERALHTLTGSARMSGIDSIAQVTKAMENQVKPTRLSGQPVSAALLALFARATAAVEQRVAELPAVGAGAEALLALLPELTAWSEPESVVMVAAESAENAEEVSISLPELTGDEVSASSPELIIEIEPEPELKPESEPELKLELESLHTPELELELESELNIAVALEPESIIDNQASALLSEPIIAIEPKLESEQPIIADDAAPVLSPEPIITTAPVVDTVEPAPDPEMAAVFLEEARDLLDKLDSQFRDWLLTPQDSAALAGINRLLHTLKGGARLSGLSVIGDLSHALETRLKTLADNQAVVNDITLELAQRAVDMLSLQVDAVEQGAPIPRMSQLVAELSGDSDAAPAAVPQMRPANPAPIAPQPTAPADAQAPEGSSAIAAIPQIRVRSDLLNRLVNHAGEISIYRGRLTQRNGQLGFGLGELDQTVVRLREQLRQLEIETQAQILNRFERSGETTTERTSTATNYDAEFDPLEFDRFSRLQQLSGSLAETINDLISVKEMLAGYQREITDLLTQQARVADDLQDGLLRTRLVPFVQVVPRLHRLVRQTAETLGKSARLEVIGPEVELDRTILDRLVAPLEHLLRNAVDHGLEDTKTRVARGKPATGLVTLALRREGNDAVISLSDDGKGLDLEAIRSKAISRGLMTADSKLPDEAILQFIMEPGFTTSGKVTQISGRGVGLDVVSSEIKAANGTMSLESVPGKGARFVIRLPLTLAIIDAFLVSVGDTVYAVPHSTVEGLARINREELLAIYADPSKTYAVRGQRYRVAYLGTALETNGPEPEVGDRRWLPILLARIGDQRVALQADTLLESQRILVKPLGPQLAGVRWLSGGTILPDGRVALILDALALVRSGAIREQAPVLIAPEPTSAAVCVLVVDDSLTVRRVTSRLLRRQNMDVLTAKDGVEALTLLDERVPDIILLDIEMPRMDGYELTRHIRRSERLKHLPIIMITSRTGAKHRDYATQLGVNRYLGKPYQESQLLDEISALVRK